MTAEELRQLPSDARERWTHENYPEVGDSATTRISFLPEDLDVALLDQGDPCRFARPAAWKPQPRPRPDLRLVR